MTGGEQTAILMNVSDSGFVLGASILAIVLGALGAVVFAAGQIERADRAAFARQCGMVAAVCAIVWILIGSSLAFGPIGNGMFGDPSLGVALADKTIRPGTALPEGVFILFRMAFAVLAIVLLAGAWAGRARLLWALGFTALWSVLVFAPIAHWLWGGGWLLTQIGAIDYGGGLVVYTSAGVSALVVALLIGPRSASADERQASISPKMAALGAILLLIGGLALNSASSLGANDNAAAALISASAAIIASAFAWTTFEKASDGAWSLMGLAKGSLAGLAAIAASSVYVSPLAAVIIGILGTIACFFAERQITSKLGIDDTANAFALSGVGGVVGALLLSVFLSAKMGGTGYFGAFTMFTQFAAQLIGIVAVVLWSVVGTAMAALAVSILAPMRKD
ncbi:MAG: ammonium transporter [Pseudomonadota bacterium]